MIVFVQSILIYPSPGARAQHSQSSRVSWRLYKEEAAEAFEVTCKNPVLGCNTQNSAYCSACRRFSLPDPVFNSLDHIVIGKGQQWNTAVFLFMLDQKAHSPALICSTSITYLKILLQQSCYFRGKYRWEGQEKE